MTYQQKKFVINKEDIKLIYNKKWSKKNDSQKVKNRRFLAKTVKSKKKT